MNFNSSGYFAYKKNKIQNEIEKPKKQLSKLNFLFQLFMATFIIMFIIIVIAIMKYSSKMDIEYTKGELQTTSTPLSNVSGYSSYIEDEQQRKIDKRLMLIQQEENAPSEARIIAKEKNNSEIIDPTYIEKNNKIDKIESKKAQELPQDSKKTKKNLIEDVKLQNKISIETAESNSNVTVMSKVLIGRYSTFEEAQRVQNDIKNKKPDLAPFVRKIGDVFSIQMGSYQDFSAAKNHAHQLRNKGFDVWIYQQ